jgi:hypothetical protein
MTRSLRWCMCILLICGTAVYLNGCGSGQEKDSASTPKPVQEQHDDDHDHDHDHGLPETFAAGVQMLKEHHQEIKTAFESGNDDHAHEPLHCIGELLENLPQLAKSAGIADDQVKVVQDAVDKMFEAYGNVDAAMHNDEKADYASVSNTLDESLAVLEQASLESTTEN